MWQFPYSPRGRGPSVLNHAPFFPFTGIFQATINDVGHSLRNHTQSQHQVSDVRECFEKCLADPQCLSFNLQHDSALPTRSCELNGVTKGQDPRNYVRRPGYTYYDRVWRSLLESQAYHTMLIIVHMVRTKSVRFMNKALKIAYLNYISIWISQ